MEHNNAHMRMESEDENFQNTKIPNYIKFNTSIDYKFKMENLRHRPLQYYHDISDSCTLAF